MMDQATAGPAGGEAMPQQQPQQQGAPMGGMSEQANPEEQGQYDEIVGSAMNMVYDKKVMPSILKGLEGDGDPIAGLAQTAALVLMRIYQSAKKAGKDLDGVVMFHAGTEVLEDLATLSIKAKIHDFKANPDDLEGAYFLALDNFRMEMQKAGNINPEAAKQDFANLQQMSADGSLEKKLTGMAQNGAGKGSTDDEAEDAANGTPNDAAADQGGGPDIDATSQRQQPAPSGSRGGLIRGGN